LAVVVEMSKTSWLVSDVVPGVERQPLKKLEPDATAIAIDRAVAHRGSRLLPRRRRLCVLAADQADCTGL
jgi:hypothetical protein